MKPLLRSALPIAFVLTALCGFAQRTDTLAHGVARHVLILPSVYMSSSAEWSIADMHALSPGSTLLGRDLSAYSLVHGRSFSAAPSVNGSIALGIKHHSTSASGPLLRVGFGFTSGINSNASLRNETRTPYDTLTSAQTGHATYIDSVVTSTYDVRHTYQRVALDASLIYCKQIGQRWTLYGGIGAWAGMAFNGETTVEHSVARGQQPVVGTIDTQNPSEGRNRDAMEREVIHTANSFVSGVYVPIGISWRIARDNAFLRLFHLTYEMRPTLGFGGVPELNTMMQGGVSQSFGVRMDLH